MKIEKSESAVLALVGELAGHSHDLDRTGAHRRNCVGCRALAALGRPLPPQSADPGFPTDYPFRGDEKAMSLTTHGTALKEAVRRMLDGISDLTDSLRDVERETRPEFRAVRCRPEEAKKP